MKYGVEVFYKHTYIEHMNIVHKLTVTNMGTIITT